MRLDASYLGALLERIPSRWRSVRSSPDRSLSSCAIGPKQFRGAGQFSIHSDSGHVLAIQPMLGICSPDGLDPKQPVPSNFSEICLVWVIPNVNRMSSGIFGFSSATPIPGPSGLLTSSCRWAAHQYRPSKLPLYCMCTGKRREMFPSGDGLLGNRYR